MPRRLSFPFLDRWREVAPFVIRGVAGVVFAYHGWQKLQRGVAGFGGFLDSLGVPFPGPMARVVVALELVGGIMLVAGLLTRVIALLVAVQMVFTTLLVKVDVGLIAPMGGGAGAELDVLLWAIAVALVLLGPGVLAIDRVLGIEARPVRTSPVP